MSRFKTFDSTGLATAGRLYAGDLNAIQDLYADLMNLTQNHGVGSLAVGESGLQLLRYGAGEARLSGAMRSDGILRALGGLYAGAFTTAQRNAIAAGSRPYGLIILNTDTNQFEWNSGSDTTPNWVPLGGAISQFSGQTGSYTLVLADAGKIVEVNSASANTVTVPADATVAFQVGVNVTIVQMGAGQTTIGAAGGVTLRSYNNSLRLAGQNAMASIVKRTTNDWWAVGNLVP